MPVRTESNVLPIALNLFPIYNDCYVLLTCFAGVSGITSGTCAAGGCTCSSIHARTVCAIIFWRNKHLCNCHNCSIELCVFWLHFTRIEDVLSFHKKTTFSWVNLNINEAKMLLSISMTADFMILYKALGLNLGLIEVCIHDSNMLYFQLT